MKIDPASFRRIISGFPVVPVIFVLFLFVAPASAWDPLYYQNLASVLQSMHSDGDVALGFFSSSSRWVADSTGKQIEHDLPTALSVIRVLATGRYGITNSHTVSILIPAFIQVSGAADTSGAGICGGGSGLPHPARTNAAAAVATNGARNLRINYPSRARGGAQVNS